VILSSDGGIVHEEHRALRPAPGVREFGAVHEFDPFRDDVRDVLDRVSVV